MDTNVIKLDAGNIRPATVPAMVRNVDAADTAYVITIKNGKWSFQSIKNGKSPFETIGLLRCISLKLEQLVNQ